ncbi:MAG: acyl-ACP--UDP-N-acetylglucosamine O-acyltransferase [Planctomycetota bacterium]
MSRRIHPTAIIDERARLGEDVEVGAYCVVGPDAALGDGVVLHNHVTVMDRTVIGSESVVYPYAVLGAEPQDLKYAGGETRLTIGERVRIREHATVHRGTELGGGETRIGNDCLIMVGVHVAHDCIIEDEVVIANGTMLGGHCLVEFGAGIGGGAGLHHFTTVGTLAFVGGMARVSKDVPPYVVCQGDPAEPRKLNTTALMRRRLPVDLIDQLRDAFKRLYRSPELPSQATIESLRAGPRTPREVHRLCDFVERTQSGTFGRQREADRNANADDRVG